MTEKKLDEAAAWFSALQTRIIATLEKLEAREGSSARFSTQAWSRGRDRSRGRAGDGGGTGGGVMRMLRGGKVIEKGGVHFSDVFGEVAPALAATMPEHKQGSTFRACGVSVIIHTLNPHAPSVHLNLRHIKMESAQGDKLWFGGGTDLTPMLPAYRTATHEDTLAFHARLEKACAPFSHIDYQALKKWCADYFYLAHRKTERGVGGIFFDDLHSGDWEKDFAFTQAVGEAFLEIYPELLQHRIHTPFTAQEKTEQAKTRSLYAEFNLLYDRGTQFGLKSGGNVEAILSSLPPLAIWE